MDLSSGTVGAVGELLVATDLLLRGFEVFRALSPACSCDLAVLSSGQLLRVEVTTGHMAPNGKVFSRSKEPRFDLLAVVVHSSPVQIVYTPELPPRLATNDPKPEDSAE
jgi:hypothetical protein